MFGEENSLAASDNASHQHGEAALGDPRLLRSATLSPFCALRSESAVVTARGTRAWGSLSLRPRSVGRRGFLVAIGGALTTSAHAGAVWQLASGYRAEIFMGRNLRQFGDDVALATGGALRIELHANNSLVKLADIPAAVAGGRIAVGEALLSGMADLVPLAGADAVPFVTRGYDDALRLWRHQAPALERDLTARGLRALFAVPWPPQGLYSVRPVERSADLAGSRMRTYNPTTVRIAQLLGATAVDVPMVDVGRAFASGRIDSMITSAVTGVDNRVWEQVRYFYDIKAWIPKNVVLVSIAAWQALAPPLRDAVLGAARAAESRGWQLSRVAATESLETLRRAGMQVLPTSQPMAASMRRLGERFSIEWIREVGTQANAIFIPFYSAS